MSAEVIRRADSIEYLEVKVAADVELGSQAVALYLERAGVKTPHAAAWVGDAGTTRTARSTSVVGPLDAGLYGVLVKLTDSPEVPVIKAYDMRVTAAGTEAE